MNTVGDLLSTLRKNGVSVWLEDGQLRYRAPEGALLPVRLAELRAQKTEVVEFLKHAQQLKTRKPAFLVQTRPKNLPLSHAQERLWLLEQIGGVGSAYNIPAAVQLRGVLDVAALDRSFATMVERHEGLRTRFRVDNGIPVQLIDPPGVFALQVEDLSVLPEAERAAAARERSRAITQQPFCLEQGSLFRAHLLRLSGEDHVAVVSMHHIVSDGWSIGVLIREVGALYGAYSDGRGSPLPELAVQYADYAVWQREWLQGAVLEKQVGYWKQRLSGAPGALELPTDRVRPAVQSYRGAHHGFGFPAHLTVGLNELGRSEGATLFMVLLAAFNVVLWRWSGQSDIVVGSPIAGRTHRELEGLIGFFVNTLALRTELGGRPSFRELVGRVKETALGAYAHQDLPFEKLVAELSPVRDLSRQPIFQVLFALQNVPQETLELPGLRLSRIGSDQATAKFDLSLHVYEREGKLEGYFEYATDLFEGSTVARIASHFRTLLEGVVADPDLPLGELPLLPARERRQLLEEWNATAAAYPRDKCLHELFAEQAGQTPEAVALVYEDSELSYGELDRRSNQLAHYLRGLGVGPETVVGLCVERSLEMVVGLLGILKAGGAYLPLDPGYPAERLAYMVGDAKAPVLVTQARLAGDLPAHGAQVVEIDADWARIERCPAGMPRNLSLPDNLAYVIYTSGSTGKPKGVSIAQRSLVNLLSSMAEAPGIKPSDVMVAVTPLSFDIAGLEIYLPLLVGAQVVVAPRAATLDGDSLRACLGATGASLMQATPSSWRLLQQVGFDGTGLKVLCGGEALPVDLAGELTSRSAEAWNLYGPTETTIWSVVGKIKAERSASLIPIGCPIWNTQAYVLDGDLTPVPIGVGGELYIGGVGLARGYLGRAGLTGERFVPSPFGDGERLYRTGDLARWRADGELEYLGRIDHQVKVRGYRIELGEIEARLVEHGSVGQAVVVARDEGADRQLVAYIVGDGVAPEPSLLRAHLKHSLPDYMMPSAFVLLDALPLTPNGKVDRRALPAPEGDAVVRGEYVAPRTPVEELLASIWCEVLKLDRVGVNDNFFELGGHSLLAMRLVARARDAFQTELPLRALFEAPSLGGLAARIEAVQREGSGLSLPPLKAMKRPAVLPLSHAQQRLWFIHQHVEGQETAYNMPVALRLLGPLSVPALEAAFTALIARHEILRTVFIADSDGAPSQVITECAVFPLPVIDVSAEEGKRYAQAHARERFDLASGPMLKAALLRQNADDYLLLLNMHHIASDGWSMGIMFRDLQQFYKAALTGETSPLAPLPVQYADYAVWQLEHDLAPHLTYWMAALAGYEEGISLPYDHVGPAGRLWRAETLHYRYPKALVEGVSRLSQAEQCTIFMSLLAALSVVLHRYSARTDLCIGTTVAGREHLQLENLIGCFVNILPLRLDLSGDPTGSELLARVRGTTIDGFEHQALPFEHLLTALRLHRDTSQTALVPVMARHQNIPPAPLEAWRGGLETHFLPVGLQTAKCELDFQFFGEGLELTVMVEYAADLFDRGTVERLLRHHEQVLEELVAAPRRRLSTYSILSKAEQDLLLREWATTDSTVDEGLSIPELFERQVARTPEGLACVSETDELSYRELNERANRLARALRALQVGPETRVGLYLDRSTDFLVGLVGVFKAGGAYVPLDPGHPLAYVQQILADAMPQVIITTSALGQHLCDSEAVLLDVSSVGSSPATNLPSMLQPDQLAYVMYTSGSTGRPKGVMVPHRQILNWLYALWNRMPFGKDEMVVQKTTSGFAVSVKELLAGLLAGSPQIILADEVVKDGLAFTAALRRWRVTRLNIVPSHLEALLSNLGPATEVLSSLRHCVTAGEPLTQALCAKVQLALPWVGLWNNYGCTELNDVAYCSAQEREAGGLFVPIGRPIANTWVYVLDAALRPVPIGVTGELCVETVGAARGYWRQPGLTAERFVPNPYSDRPGSRLYRTGDMARYLADGRLDYLGREDFEVKIRGHRIDLRQVEKVLAAYPGIVHVVVQGWSVTDSPVRLVAYYVAGNDVQITAPMLREHLSARLPGFMVPQLYVALRTFPRLANGKLNRLALPAPDLSGESSEYVAPRTPAEEIVAGIFADLLKPQRLGVYDNFFDLGGHSLLAMRVMARLRDAFQIELPLRALFEAPTVAGLVERLEAAKAEERHEAEDERRWIEELEARVGKLSETELRESLHAEGISPP